MPRYTPHSEETKRKISEKHKGRILSPEHRQKLREVKLLNPVRYWLGKHRPDMVIRNMSPENPYKRKGVEHHRYVSDRSKLKKQQIRNDSAYADWRKSVYSRDGFKCRIGNKDCSGRIIAHHILGWASYPELRYDLNNGITLCEFHHPRTRKAEREAIEPLKEILNKKLL